MAQAQQQLHRSKRMLIPLLLTQMPKIVTSTLSASFDNTGRVVWSCELLQAASLADSFLKPAVMLRLLA